VSNNSAQPTRTPQPTRTTAQIEADLGATRDRLAASVGALIDQVHPNRIKQRQIANLRRFVNTEVENAKSKIFTARGDLRKGRIAAIAAAIAGIVGFLLIVRSIVRRGKSDDEE
jgi:phosphoribosylformylglycinamidine (FGAM) synthase-like enzyme